MVGGLFQAFEEKDKFNFLSFNKSFIISLNKKLNEMKERGNKQFLSFDGKIGYLEFLNGQKNNYPFFFLLDVDETFTYTGGWQLQWVCQLEKEKEKMVEVAKEQQWREELWMRNKNYDVRRNEIYNELFLSSASFSITQLPTQMCFLPSTI